LKQLQLAPEMVSLLVAQLDKRAAFFATSLPFAATLLALVTKHTELVRVLLHMSL
jgi:hypothetical protein